MKRILISFLALALCAAAFPFLPADAQEAGGRPNSSPRSEKTLDQVVRKYERLRLNPAEAARGVRAGGRLLLATAEHSFDLELRPNDMRAEDYRAEETGAGGVRTLLASGPVRTYKGAVRGQSKAQARFTVDDETLEGMIITPAERYYVEPLSKYEPGADEADFVLYRKSDVIESDEQMCGVTLDQEISQAAAGVQEKLAVTGVTTLAAAPAGMLYEAEIATEADYEYVTALGGSAAANAEILSIMNQVDGVYEAELGISFKIVHQHAWASNTTGYPYTTAVGPDLLQKFTDHWNANFSSVRRDVAHMWSGKNLVDPTNNPGLIGIAWMGTVCVAPHLSYGISQRMTNAVHKSILTAHELGHNFGAAHTGASGCDNTVMNAYIGTRLTFCPASRADVDSYVTYAPACMTQVCNPTFSPAGQTFTDAGGAGSLAVAAGASCAWAAKSNDGWIVITSGASGPGSKTVNYTVAANPAAAPRTGTLTVAGKTYTVTQGPKAGIKGLTLNPANIAGGKRISGTVALSLPAPAGGAIVALSDNLAATTVPVSVTVPAGATSKSFAVTTSVTPTAQSGIFTASYNGTAMTAPLTVRPAVLSSFTLSPDVVMGSKDVTATVSLDGPAPATGAVVTLTDTLAAAAAPASVTIPAGATLKTFVIPTTFVSAKQAGGVTAKYAGVSLTAALTVRPVSVSAVVLTPEAITGGSAIQGLVMMEGPAPVNVNVTLTENLTSASVPATVTVPAGATTKSFTITTTAVSVMQDGVLTAAAAGGSRSASFTVERGLVRCTNLGYGAAKTSPVLSLTTIKTMVTADFNHDHKLDIVASVGSVISTHLGSGTGAFVQSKQLVVGVIVNDMAVGDFNQDGNRDLAATYGHGKTAILLGDGKGSFGTPVHYVTGDRFTVTKSLVVSDINGDGKQDVVVADWSTNIYVMLGDGLGGFGKPYKHWVSGYPAYDIAAGDFNGDGRPDLARSEGSSALASVMMGDGAGAFAAALPVSFSNPPVYFQPVEIVVGDFNKDGKQDLAASQSQGSLATLLGDGNGGFGTPTHYTGSGYDIYTLLLRDMNGDRNDDLVTVGDNNIVSIYRGDGTGKFGAPFNAATLAATARGLAVGDFNNDGKRDLAVGSYTGGLDGVCNINVMLSTCR